MPEKDITIEQESGIDSYLRDKKARGVEVVLDSSSEGSVLFDNYTVGAGYLNLTTDLDDRARLNKVECDDETARELEETGVVNFSGKPQQYRVDSLNNSRQDAQTA